MRKILILPILFGTILLVSFSFIPILEAYHLYSWEQKIEKNLGEGQKFTDPNGKRCLMSESDGFNCPITSQGYNPETGKYDTGVSGAAALYAQQYGLDDPYDPTSINRIGAIMSNP